jgi:thiol-disulfide isomerase/thioredoxin
MLTTEFLKTKFHDGLTYQQYLDSATPDQRKSWQDFHARVRPTEAQRALVKGFVREVNVLVVSGTWCGDCVRQIPFLDHLERMNPDRLRVRYFDRDEHSDLSSKVTICGGTRVPVALLLNEDYDFLALVGDRTLSRYRVMAASQLGASCPLPGAPVPADEIAATFQDWVDEIERAHLICRLSTKLRQKHLD